VCWLFLVGWEICPILDLKNLLIGLRMYLQDRCYPTIFIGRFYFLFVFRLRVDFILFAGSPWDCGRVARVGYWFIGLPLELGLALWFVRFVYVFVTRWSFMPFVWISL
jgi:hypothetical protein